MTQSENNISSRPVIDDGGPAFPSTTHTAEGHAVNGPEFGMTLRDYFAAKAMQGDMACQSAETGEFVSAESFRILAKRAYWAADAMLEARKA